MNKYICRRVCEVKDCPYHFANVPDVIPAGTNAQVVHLEGNPLFCKKNNWHGNQVEVGESDKN